jgi:ribonucleoside-diphosphate reductase alpha chain
MALAPTASTSIIMGNTSPSMEPMRANAYRQDTLSGAFLNKNMKLDKVLRTIYKEEDLPEIWSSIISNDGSVQHLKELDEQTKEVFKTAIEIDQRWIIEHAADRQQYIDQGQSINLFFKPDVNIKYLHTVHFLAWKKKLKSLYYCRSESIGKVDKISQKIERQRLDEIDLKQVAEGEDCLACSS